MDYGQRARGPGQRRRVWYGVEVVSMLRKRMLTGDRRWWPVAVGNGTQCRYGRNCPNEVRWRLELRVSQGEWLTVALSCDRCRPKCDETDRKGTARALKKMGG
ncbi:MAG TPA: hypothetical protein VEI97_13155 [bacterium]|nr:hypothetical protein [bacterium]